MNELPYVYAAMLDVLGYRELLNRDRRSGSLDFKRVLESALSCLAEINDAEFAYQAISDTVIITCSDRSKFANFLQVVKTVQLGFLNAGLLLRGGIAFQQHFRSGSVTYSPAYATAYELESKVAIYPRVVIDHNIIEMLESNGSAEEFSKNQLICERNGIYFLNFVDAENWSRVFGEARDIFTADSAAITRNEAVFLKHAWLQDYLLQSPYAVSGSDAYVPLIRVWRMGR